MVTDTFLLCHSKYIISNTKWAQSETLQDGLLNTELYSPLSMLFSEKADVDEKMLVVSFFFATGADLEGRINNVFRLFITCFFCQRVER